MPSHVFKSNWLLYCCLDALSKMKWNKIALNSRCVVIFVNQLFISWLLWERDRGATEVNESYFNSVKSAQSQCFVLQSHFVFGYVFVMVEGNTFFGVSRSWLYADFTVYVTIIMFTQRHHSCKLSHRSDRVHQKNYIFSLSVHTNFNSLIKDE